jgi:integral membrane sensor domain MASE1
MQPPAATSSARRPAFVFEVLAAAIVYFATARLGLELAVVARQVSIIWPATGFALALLVLRGRRLWPAILVGAFAANALNETSILASAGIAIGNTLEARAGWGSIPPCAGCTMWRRCSCWRRV